MKAIVCSVSTNDAHHDAHHITLPWHHTKQPRTVHTNHMEQSVRYSTLPQLNLEDRYLKRGCKKTREVTEEPRTQRTSEQVCVCNRGPISHACGRSYMTPNGLAVPPVSKFRHEFEMYVSTLWQGQNRVVSRHNSYCVCRSSQGVNQAPGSWERGVGERGRSESARPTDEERRR